MAGAFTQVRQERDRKRKRAEIIDAAERIFRKKGYRLATTDDIARESGYSVGTLYNLFDDKDSLYSEMLERIGKALLARLDHTVLNLRDPEQAIEALIRVRLYNYSTDRLFFLPYLTEGDFGMHSQPGRLSPAVEKLHQRYLDAVNGIFKRMLSKAGVTDMDPLHLTLSLEGIINAFMGYWSRPGQSDDVAATARHIKDTVLGQVRLKRWQEQGGQEQYDFRIVHISKFDLDRLRELLVVAREFGGADGSPHLDELESELIHAKVISPQEAPPDLITMNSRVQLRELTTHRVLECALVFPKDAPEVEESVSILAPLGTALLGKRVGETVTVHTSNGAATYRVEALLYQPEAAGDYHL